MTNSMTLAGLAREGAISKPHVQNIQEKKGFPKT